MIRRDYLIKLVQELSAVLLRIISLKNRREFAAALYYSAAPKYIGRCRPARRFRRISIECWTSAVAMAAQ